MANRYWIANYTATPTFSTAANWADNADGTGANTAPTANDTVHFGHPTTLAAGLGYGSCELSGATVALSTLTTYSGYNKVEMIGKFDITAVSRQFVVSPVGSPQPSTIGFKAGMVVTVTGCANAANNDTYQIQSVASGVMTMTTAAGGSSMANEAAGSNITITYDPAIDLKGQILNINSASGSLLTLDSKIKNTTGNGKIVLTNVFIGGSGNRYFKCGDNQTFENRDTITMEITNTSGGSMYFDDGIYPIVELKGGAYSCDYATPTSDIHGQVKFYKFKETTTVPTWVSGGGSKRNNTKKIFRLDNMTDFALITTYFDTGESTWVFDVTDANLKVPVNGDYANYPSGFRVRWNNLIFENTSGNSSRKAIIPARRNLCVNSLTVDYGVNLEGSKTPDEISAVDTGTTTISCTTRPTIRGSWNFVQVADGVYTSLLCEAFSITPSHGVKGHIQFSYDGGAFHSHSKMLVVTETWTGNDKLLLDEGAYLSTGWMMFNQIYAAGAGTGTNNAIWSSNDSPTVLYYTDSAGTHHNLLAGGGGGGGVTVQDEGVTLATTATTLNFVGAGVVASGTGATKTITIAGGGGGAGEVVEFVNDNTTINMNTTIAVCASNTDCTAKAGVVGQAWSGMSASIFQNYDFTATGALNGGAAFKGLIDVPAPTVGRKLTLLVPYPCNGRDLPQGITQITCTGQNNAFIGHDLAGMLSGKDGAVSFGSQVILPEQYLYRGWTDPAGGIERRLNTQGNLGHHAITLVGVPAPTGDDAALVITNVGENDVTMGDVVDTAKWWVETNNEFLWDVPARGANPSDYYFDDRGWRASAWGQLYVVC